ncbi:MAG: bifunctional homocysteine S-methyltransferase/methylenetetrahydrofolate reductase [Clostridia bacterium]|nr:bifunctional homocysteine S-methyltransferase/methylenetetrahydrofolate reductase [Clostridia bacterium]
MSKTAEKIRSLAKDNVLFFDGAFGTYFSLLFNEENCEAANISSPERTEKIHKQYAEAGANLLRTNTYSANRFNEYMDEAESEKIIRSGFKIAANTASQFDLCFPCADIGPVNFNPYENENIDSSAILEEYKRIIDIFLDEGAEVFVFETMSDISPLDKAVEYLRSKSDAYIICQFAFRPDGFTKSALGIESVVEAFNSLPCDSIGFNCASGPAHILSHVKKAVKLTSKPLSALPNASFPSLYEGRQIYNEAEGYFVQIMLDVIKTGVTFVGGCCGTTPAHIFALVDSYKNKGLNKVEESAYEEADEYTKEIAKTNVDIFVELSPPTTSKLPSLLNKCHLVSDLGIDQVTLPDSPLARTRMNPLIISSEIRSKAKLNTLVHMCCRDRNIIAMQSDILAGWALGLRSLLCVTGDPVAAGGRDDIKSVFNISSINLMQLVSHMNNEIFCDAPIKIYGAVNLAAKNFDAVLKRTQSKVDAGATGFLSQPIFSESDIERVKEFKEKFNAKLYVGIMPPVTYKNALFLSNEVPDINIPNDIIEGFSKITDANAAEEYGCNVVGEIAVKSLQYADGLYIMPPFGRISCVRRIIDYINNNS